MSKKEKIAAAHWFISRTRGDIIIWMIVLILSVFSVMTVYSSTSTIAYKLQKGNTEYYLFKHTAILILGLCLMYVAHTINYKYFSRFGQILLILSVPLIIITYFAGSSINSAHRSFTLPVINLSFHTSDLAKVALIMFLARLLSKKQEMIKDFWKTTVPAFVWVILICGLIAPSNLSTAVVLFATSLVLMFIGRMNIKHILLIVSACFIIGFSSIYIIHKIGTATGHPIGRIETWWNRIDHYMNDKDDEVLYQNQQANIAIAKGGVFGTGPGKSIQKNFLPNSYDDFIYAIIIEEYGLIGGCILIFLYLILLYRSIRIVVYSPRAFGALLAVGLSFSLVFQALINMGVAVNLLPNTGLALPLVSMGGTSLWFTSLAIGIILSISRDIEEKENLENTDLWAPVNS